MLCTELVRRMRTTTHARNKIFSPVQAKQTYEGICKNCSGIACKISVRAGGRHIAARRVVACRRPSATQNPSNQQHQQQRPSEHTTLEQKPKSCSNNKCNVWTIGGGRRAVATQQGRLHVQHNALKPTQRQITQRPRR